MMDMNAFDDNLKNRAGDFRLEPRKEVWERVEQELGSKKRKRRLVWFWWFAPLLLAGSAMWFLQSPSTELKKPATNDQVTLNTSPVEITHAPLKENEINLKMDDQKKISGNNQRSIKIPNTPHAAPITTLSSGKGVHSTNRPPEDFLRQPGLKAPTETAIPNSARPGSILSETQEKEAEHSIASITADTTIRKPQTVGQPGGIDSDSTITKPLVAVGPEIDQVAIRDTQPVADVQPDPVLKDRKSSKATWRLMAGAGMHNHTGKGISLEKSMADYNSGGFSNNAGGGQGGAFLPLEPSEAGPGVMIGVERAAPVGKSRHWSWTAGLHYQYQSFKVKTGTMVDSTLNYETDRGNVSTASFYRSGSTRQQTGSQHRIHLLAALQWHIDKKQHWTWQNGLYGGIVLSSDYLIPQKSPIGWVPSAGLNRTGYTGIETGFIFRPSKWGAGVFGQYNLSNSLKIAGPAPQYWRGIELRIQYSISSKFLNK